MDNKLKFSFFNTYFVFHQIFKENQKTFSKWFVYEGNTAKISSFRRNETLPFLLSFSFLPINSDIETNTLLEIKQEKPKFGLHRVHRNLSASGHSYKTAPNRVFTQVLKYDFFSYVVLLQPSRKGTSKRGGKRKKMVKLKSSKKKKKPTLTKKIKSM